MIGYNIILCIYVAYRIDVKECAGAAEFEPPPFLLFSAVYPRRQRKSHVILFARLRNCSSQAGKTRAMEGREKTEPLQQDHM